MELRAAGYPVAGDLGVLLPLSAAGHLRGSTLSALVRLAGHARSPRDRSRSSPRRGRSSTPRSPRLGGHHRHHGGRQLTPRLNRLLRTNNPADTRPNKRRYGGANQEGHEGTPLDIFGSRKLRDHANAGLLKVLPPREADASDGEVPPADSKTAANPFSSEYDLPEPRDGHEGTGGLGRKLAQTASAWSSSLSGFLKSKVEGLGKHRGPPAPKTTLRKRRPASLPARKTLLAEAMLRARRGEPVADELEASFLTKGSQKAKRAVRKTVGQVLRESSSKGEVLPVTTDKLKLLAGCLKQAGYKAANNYLAEYKLMHIEAGHLWSQQLQRTWQLCRRAVDRSRGPKKKAMEVHTHEKGEEFTTAATRKGKIPTVPLAKECFEFGVIWMLREKEVSKVTSEDILVETPLKLVRLTWPNSKTDQEAQGVTRVLQCLCGDQPCTSACPFRVSLKLKEAMEELGLVRAGDLRSGKPSTKAQMVQQWKLLYGKEVTGHSARRTGALRLIRSGWSLSQVAFLGRWKSEVVYDYAAEALAALPVNSCGAFDSSPTKTSLDLPSGESIGFGTKVEQVRNYLTTELEAFKQDQEEVLKAFKAEVQHLNDRELRDQGLIPSWVQSRASRVTHSTLPFSYCSPPSLWQTSCGWRFHQANFIFLESAENQQLCQKCKDLARSSLGESTARF